MRKGEEQYTIHGKRYVKVHWNDVKKMMVRGKEFRGFVVGKEVLGEDYFQNMCDARFCSINNIDRATTIMKSNENGVYWYRVACR